MITTQKRPGQQQQQQQQQQQANQRDLQLLMPGSGNLEKSWICQVVSFPCHATPPQTRKIFAATIWLK
ncbi:hypothetical protein JRQ81_013733 [Phrynocephalus forsythii]|uniref:Uncharacterized protein n=1 Tax=Phrynocephalus forsythii TaxID=171643 RepID=A0A9Q1B4J7_9SAUR|nr:hypothetical protein JRQ81_013733 [Phrynocephalus forsythii]